MPEPRAPATTPGADATPGPAAEVERLRARVAELERERLARLEAEAALRESELRYRELVDQCPDPIVVHRDGILLFANQAAARMAGKDVAPADLVGRHVIAFVRPPDRDFAARAIDVVTAGGPPLGSLETRVWDSEGRERVVEATDRVIAWYGKPAVQVVVRDVTVRRRTEESLLQAQDELERRVEQRTRALSRALAEVRDREARNRAMLQASPDFFARVRRDGRVLDVNPGPLYEAAVDGKRLLGRSLRRFMPPDVAERAVAAVERVCDTGAMETRVFEMPTPVGQRQFEARIVRSGRDEILAVLRDISEAREREESLRRAERRRAAMLQASPDSHSLIHRDGTILEIHARGIFAEHFRLDGQVGRNVRETAGARDASLALEAVRRVCETGQAERLEYRSVLGGDERWFESRLVPCGDDEVLVVMRDITESRQAFEILRDREERFRTVFEEGPLGMALTADLRFLRVNAALCRSLGYAREELEGTPFLELSHPDDRGVGLEDLRRLAAGELPSVTAEKRYRHKDGYPVPFRVTSSLIRGAGGEPAYGIAMFEDVREERRAQAALRAAQQRLHHAERLASVGTLAAGIAHEINNPVGSILLAAQWALREDASHSSAAVRRSLLEIEDHARRCGGIVKNVLRFARQESLERQDADLNACVERVRELALHLADGHEVALVFDLTPERIPVRVSATAIEQVLLNVIRNAVEASAPGQLVRVSTRRGRRRALVSVEDRGRGMTAEEKTFLFDPFYTTRRAEGGTGLGLSISHGIVTDHGGRIHVESQPGRGTTLRVSLPLAPAADPLRSEA